jgi:hypothetical protein
VGTIEADAFKGHSHDSLFLDNSCANLPNSMPYSLTAGCYFAFTNKPTSSVGGSETRPVNASVNYIIKY